MKRIVYLHLFFVLVSCGLGSRVDGIKLQGFSGNVQSDAREGDEVGNVVLYDSQCENPTYSLDNNYDELFKLTREGKILLAKDNPVAGRYNVVVIGNCEGQVAKVTVHIIIEDPVAGCDISLNIKTTTVCTHCRIYEAVGLTATGDLGGIAGADTICETHVNKPITGTYKAFLVDSCIRKAYPVRRNWVLAPGTSYYRASDDQLIGTTDGNALFAPALDNSIASGAWYFATGMEPSMGSHADNCLDWTSSSAGDFFRLSEYGTGVTADDAWSTYSFGCNSINAILCVEQ